MKNDDDEIDIIHRTDKLQQKRIKPSTTIIRTDRKVEKNPRTGKRSFMPPATMGEMKKDNPYHMSIDELIAYRQTGQRPQIILNTDMIYGLARLGIGMQHISELFNVHLSTFAENEEHLNSFKAGRADCAVRMRGLIYDHAINGSLDAAKHLDRVLSPDNAQSINMTVTRIAEHIATDKLLLALDSIDV